MLHCCNEGAMESNVQEVALMVGAQMCPPSWVVTAFLHLWAQGQEWRYWLGVLLSAILVLLVRFISKT